MENPRTESARAHDDSDLIDRMEDAPGATLRSGGNLQRDVATEAELAAIDDPDGRTGVGKSDSIAHGEARAATRGPNR